MPKQPTVRDVLDALERRYPERLAAEWDAVGLICGEPGAAVRRVLFAVDPVPDVVDEALALGADMVVTHHPLFLRGVHSVAATTPGGRVVHRLVSHGVALAAAHTNADFATPGVSDALGAALGLVGLRPLVPDTEDPACGSGRVGRLPRAMPLADFAALVARALPATHHGVRVAGDPAMSVRRIAVCGGAGDAHLAAAAEVADAYLTSDLRHHRALDHRLASDCALIDVAHWASEWPWLAAAAQHLAADLAESGTTVEVRVSAIPTDPWTAHLGDRPER